jgi:plastocyanin
LPVLVALPVLALLLFARPGQVPSAHAQATLNVGAGVGGGTVSGNVYTPSDITINTGDTLVWTINSDEPHSMTFGDGPADVPPDAWPVALWTAPSGNPFEAVDLGTVDFDGSAHANSGLLGNGSTAGLTFTTEGDFTFFCVIHPTMEATVHVDDTATPPTQGELDTQVAAQEQVINDAVQPLRDSTLANIAGSEEQSDGTTLWTIAASAIQFPGPEAGGAGYLELLEFTPDELSIQEGDTVRWVADQNAFHTVTFLAEGQDASTVNPFGPPEAPSSTYDGTSFYNSGLFNATASPPDSFELTFPDAGSFPYICALHYSLGQTGTINVAAAPVEPELPVTGLTGGGDGGGGPLLAFAFAMLGLAAPLIGAGVWTRRRTRAEVDQN